VELGDRQHDVEPVPRHLFVERREPSAEQRAVSVRRHPAGRHGLPVVRQRAVHANNELRYQSWEAKNDFVKFGTKHEFKFGGRIERYHSDNVFFNCCKQGAYVYNSLDDFYAAARETLANPNITTSSIVARKLPGALHEHPRPRQAVTAADRALRRRVCRRQLAPEEQPDDHGRLAVRRAVVRKHRLPEPERDALDVRDETGAPVQYDSGAMPGANFLWSPRFGFNYDVSKDQKTQIRGGSGVFTGQPLYVWISNQLGNTGVLQGSFTTRTRRRSPSRPTSTATSRPT
jgi:hypothetical protein